MTTNSREYSKIEDIRFGMLVFEDAKNHGQCNQYAAWRAMEAMRERGVSDVCLVDAIVRSVERSK